MSAVSILYNDGSAAAAGYDTTKIFTFGNKYQNMPFENDSGGELVLLAGSVLGKEAATGNCKRYDAGGADGTQYPVGILAHDYTIADTVTETVAVCVAGEVNENKLIFFGGDTLDDVVELKTVRDRIGSDSVGIILRPVVENTKYDNN